MGFCEKCNRQDNLTLVEGKWICTVCVRDKDKDIAKKTVKDFKKSEPDFE